MKDIIQRAPKDPWVEYADEFGRTRICRKSEVPEGMFIKEGFY